MAPTNFEHINAAEISSYDRAVIAPLTRGRKTNGYWDAGLFESSGSPIAHGQLNLHKLQANPTPAVFDTGSVEAADLSGEWLFAGVLPRKTGHIIVNALGRLWATDHLPDDVGLLFVTHLYGAPEHPFLTQLLTTLGLDRRCKLVSAPTRVERLHVGPDGFSSASMGMAAPTVVDWVRRRANPDPVQSGTRKLYITRGRLSPLVGRYLCEDILEENLSGAGYDVIVPEAMSLRNQFELYAQAQEVIVAEGTALHIAVLALPDTSRLTVIQRRHDVPDLIKNHLACFLSRAACYIDAVDAMHWPEERAVNVAVTTLDFARLRQSLIGHGLLDEADPWRIPTAAEADKSRADGRGENARFLTLEEREAFLRAFRRRKRKRRR